MPAVSRGPAIGGALAIVLHTHMPYVEGFGTWPFGEEWLWEAIAGSYLPLLDLLDAGAPLTLSLTPVLCDQLEAPGVAERFCAFVQEVRRSTHEEDARGLRAGGHERLARGARALLGRLRARAGAARAARRGPARRAAPHAQWTSSATHAVLPLLASDAGVRLQVQSGVDAHRARFGAGWRGGFWLPECAYAPCARAGAGGRRRERHLRRADRLASALGAREHLQPVLGESGLVLVPIDRATMSLVWSDRGYPAAGAYRDYHHHTIHHHNPWDNDGGAYDHDARAGARTRARGGLRRADDRAPGATPARGSQAVDWRSARSTPSCSGTGGMRASPGCGRSWRSARGRVSSSCGSTTRSNGCEPQPGNGREGGEASSWGTGGDLSTWSGPPVAEMAFRRARRSYDVLAAGSRAGEAAVRELLALQASDWAFMVSRGVAAPYARERFEGHRQRLAEALAGGEHASVAGVRNLAVHADRAALLAL